MYKNDLVEELRDETLSSKNNFQLNSKCNNTLHQQSLEINFVGTHMDVEEDTPKKVVQLVCKHM